MGLAAGLLMGVVSMNFAFGNSVKSFFSPKIARAGFDVVCDCALFGGNKNCAANNYGANCAPSGSSACSSYSSNCEG